MTPSEKVKFISNWIKNYVDNMPTKAGSLVIGISGGIDSSVSSTLSAMTGIKTIVLSMPIKQSYNLVKAVTDFHLLNFCNFAPYDWSDNKSIITWAIFEQFHPQMIFDNNSSPSLNKFSASFPYFGWFKIFRSRFQ